MKVELPVVEYATSRSTVGRPVYYTTTQWYHNSALANKIQDGSSLWVRCHHLAAPCCSLRCSVTPKWPNYLLRGDQAAFWSSVGAGR